eukprot:414623_1
MADFHKHTKGALSHDNDELFKQNVNNNVFIEQMMLDDIVGDMDHNQNNNENNNIFQPKTPPKQPQQQYIEDDDSDYIDVDDLSKEFHQTKGALSIDNNIQ